MSRKKKKNSYNPAKLAEKREVQEFTKDIVYGAKFTTWAEYDAWSDEQCRLDYEAAERVEREWVEAGRPDRSGTQIIFGPTDVPIPTRATVKAMKG